MFCLQLKQNKTKQHIRTLEAACFLCVCVCFCLLVGHVFCLQSPPSSYTLKFTHKKQGSRLKPWQLHVVFSCVFFCLLAMQHLPTALCFLLKKKKKRFRQQYENTGHASKNTGWHSMPEHNRNIKSSSSTPPNGGKST